MIDINQPVKEGDDVVINEGGDQHLGSYEEFNEKAKEGLLTGVFFEAPVESPAEEPEQPEQASADVPAKRASNGRFTKSE